MPYYGGKQTTAGAIVALFPPHRMYVEPYAGGLSVLLAKPVEPIEVVNDLDRDLVNFWRVLRDHPEELLTACELTPHAVSEFEDDFTIDGDDLERARRVWVRLTQGRSAHLLKTGWRHSLGADTAPGVSMPGYLEGYRKRLLPAAARLKHVTLECRPALEIIDRYSTPGTLLYVDPPYLGTTRNSTGYRHDMLGEQAHVDMLEALRRTEADVVLSGYASPLYDDMLAGWHRHEMGTRTQAADRVEVVWANSADDSALFSMAGLAESHSAQTGER